MKTLENLRELAYRAYLGISFTPENRAESIINEYSEELDKDVELLRSKGSDEENIEKYKCVYIEHLKAWLSAKSMCISSMIAGPSKFPVRRAEKANNREHAKYNEFREYRDKVFKYAEKRELKNQIEEAGGELEVAKKKLQDLISLQERMKKINKAYPSYKKHGLPGLEKFELSESDIKVIISFVPQYSFERLPFQGCSLTNNNAKIKNTEARVKQLESKEEKKEAGENKEIKIQGGVCVYDYSLDRITIKHDQKPSSEVIGQIKSHGFKWSPFHKVWMRKITQNAIYTTEKLLLPKLNSVID